MLPQLAPRRFLDSQKSVRVRSKAYVARPSDLIRPTSHRVSRRQDGLQLRTTRLFSGRSCKSILASGLLSKLAARKYGDRPESAGEGQDNKITYMAFTGQSPSDAGAPAPYPSRRHRAAAWARSSPWLPDKV